jgi:hypothetical protein
MQSLSALSSSPVSTKQLASDLQTISTLIVQANETADAIILETTTSTLTAQVDRVKNAESALSTNSQLMAVVVEQDQGIISSSTTSTMSCDANVTSSCTADLRVVTDMLVITNGVFAHVDLNTTRTMRATCTVSMLDLGISYMIPADDRYYVIDREIRTAQIEYEERTELIGRL